MITFRNPGSMDISSITTFGISSKEKAGAIGFFGTGLKYAIAILLREGCDVTIQTGGQVLKFAKESARVRVNDFTFVTMNGERLAFTTELGKTWELWAAFRELYCNCLDENGVVAEGPLDAPVGDDETVVMVTGDRFLDVWSQRSEIILSKTPIIKHESVNICPGISPHVFYRGVRVAKLPNASRFTYDIQRKIDLTEDRTIKYDWDINASIQRAWMESDDERLIEIVLTSPQGTYEHGIQFAGHVPSEAFRNVVQRLRLKFAPCNPTAWEACRIWIMDKMHEAEPAKLSALDTARLEKAINFCESVGFAVRSFPIHVSEFLGENVLGQAHEGRIYISKRTFMMGTKMLAGTLIEEFIHLSHRCEDGTRVMQNILIDTICGLGEQINGEPL